MYNSLEKHSIVAAEESIIKEDGHNQAPTAAEERGVVRKLDIYLLTMIWVLYTFVALDRSNIGYAKVAGMEKGIYYYPLRYHSLATQTGLQDYTRYCLEPVYADEV
jgi:hypothetical protein